MDLRKFLVIALSAYCFLLTPYCLLLTPYCLLLTLSSSLPTLLLCLHISQDGLVLVAQSGLF
jgi:hypothetical protein